MDAKSLEFHRNALLTRLSEIEQEDAATTADRATVTLDQQSVGRLSRMDAMQQQAMANATHTRRQQETQRIKAALIRMKEGEFGYCLDCGDEIDEKRLEFDATAPRCITCVRG